MCSNKQTSICITCDLILRSKIHSQRVIQTTSSSDTPSLYDTNINRLLMKSFFSRKTIKLSFHLFLEQVRRKFFSHSTPPDPTCNTTLNADKFLFGLTDYFLLDNRTFSRSNDLIQFSVQIKSIGVDILQLISSLFTMSLCLHCSP